MASSATKICPQCGTHLAGASAVEGLCSACLLSVGLQGGQDDRPPSPAPARGLRATVPPRELHPVGAGIVAPNWAMPVELLRQASRRLRVAAVGVALTFAVAILLNNLIEAARMIGRPRRSGSRTVWPSARPPRPGRRVAPTAGGKRTYREARPPPASPTRHRPR